MIECIWNPPMPCCECGITPRLIVRINSRHYCANCCLHEDDEKALDDFINREAVVKVTWTGWRL